MIRRLALGLATAAPMLLTSQAAGQTTDPALVSPVYPEAEVVPLLSPAPAILLTLGPVPAAPAIEWVIKCAVECSYTGSTLVYRPFPQPGSEPRRLDLPVRR